MKAARAVCHSSGLCLLGDLLDHPPEEVRVRLFDPEPFELGGDLTAVVGRVIDNTTKQLMNQIINNFCSCPLPAIIPRVLSPILSRVARSPAWKDGARFMKNFLLALFV